MFGYGSQIDFRDVPLYDTIVLGINMGLRYDELGKMSIEHLNVIPGILGTGIIQVFIPVAINGNSRLSNFLIADPFIALLTSMRVRENRPRFPFCLITDNNMVQASWPWNNLIFSKFLR